MPSGYWSGVWAVLWQSTLLNSAILIAAYWLRMPVSGYSIFMPIAAPFTVAALGLAAIIVATVLAYAVGFFASSWTIWAATAGFVAVYTLYSLPKPTFNHGSVDAGLSGFQLVLAIVAVAIWWLRIIRPLHQANVGQP